MATPPPAGVQRRMERNRQKLVGRDKGSLTEEQTKENSNNNDTAKENTQNKIAEGRKKLSPPTAATHSRATGDFRPPSSPQPEPSMTTHGMEYPALFGQVGSARPAVCPPGSW